MCRFVLYLGPPLTIASLITEPVNSLINQSIHSREQAEPLNGDGFGVAWYIHRLSPHPAVFRAVTPAWNNPSLLSLAKVTRSGTILAHVRAATSGTPATELNCHPFSSGPYTFMHNGDLPGFPVFRRTLLAGLSDVAFATVRGNTDSEHLFAVFLDKVNALPADKPAQRLATALSQTIEYGVKTARGAGTEAGNTFLNIAVSDGRCAAASRFSTADAEETLSLYVHRGTRYVCRDGVCRMVSPKGRGAVLISSERLSDDPGWESVPNNHMVTVNEEHQVSVRALG
jgi:glutamine amidotransferase